MRMKIKSLSITAPTARISPRQWIQNDPQVRMQRTANGYLATASVQQSNPQIATGWHQAESNDHHLYAIDAAGSIENWRLLLKELSTLVGNQGTTAIFLSSVNPLSTQYPGLATLAQHQHWPEQLAILQYTLQQLPRRSAARAQQSLWWRGSQLLTKLLGESLCRRLLQQVALQSLNRHG
jgi:hypothetical protein